jgi:hypothetical protein
LGFSIGRKRAAPQLPAEEAILRLILYQQVKLRDVDTFHAILAIGINAMLKNQHCRGTGCAARESITQVIDSAGASPNSLRTGDH